MYDGLGWLRGVGVEGEVGNGWGSCGVVWYSLSLSLSSPPLLPPLSTHQSKEEEEEEEEHILTTHPPSRLTVIMSQMFYLIKFFL